MEAIQPQVPEVDYLEEETLEPLEVLPQEDCLAVPLLLQPAEEVCSVEEVLQLPPEEAVCSEEHPQGQQEEVFSEEVLRHQLLEVACLVEVELLLVVVSSEAVVPQLQVEEDSSVELPLLPRVEVDCLDRRVVQPNLASLSKTLMLTGSSSQEWLLSLHQRLLELQLAP